MYILIFAFVIGVYEWVSDAVQYGPRGYGRINLLPQNYKLEPEHNFCKQGVPKPNVIATMRTSAC